MRYLKYLLTFLVLIVTTNTFAASDQIYLNLKGHLSKDEIAKAKKELDLPEHQPAKTIAIELNSSSGDLFEVLDLAKRLYEWKIDKNGKLVIYINDQAIGPSAVIPFLADQLMISPFVAWGDIPSGSELTMSTNLLRSRVKSLISDSNPNANILKIIAEGMTDSNTVIIDDSGWQISSKSEMKNHQIVLNGAETLVLNQNQMQTLKLVSSVMTAEQFRQTYSTTHQPTPANQETGIPAATEVPNLIASLKEHVHFNAEGPNTIGYISIDSRSEGITQSTWIYVKSALEFYKKTRPSLIILRLDTPGGEVFAAQKISDALKEMDTQYHIPVVAFIDNWAISAGAMLAYSCRYIAVVKDASMGAAEPVLAGEGGEMKTASEKVNSALRADFGNRAQFFDRNPQIAEGMVDKDIILVMRYGKIIKLDNETQIKTTGSSPDKVIKAKGKLLTLTSRELMEYGVADISLQPLQMVPITDTERFENHWPASKMALFHQPFFDAIPQATVVAYEMDWKTKFMAFLTKPVISSLLFAGLMLALYVEVTSGGFGLAGSIGLTCLMLIILSSFALEAVSWLEIILLLMGLVLLIVDFFFLPTFGFLGSVGAIFLIMGLFGLLLPGLGSASFEFDTKTWNAAGEVVFERLAWLAGSLLLSIGLITILARYLTPRMNWFKRFVSTGEQDSSQGYVAGLEKELQPKQGDVGFAATTLRPAGKVMIHDTLFDAVSSGEFIEKDEPVVVVDIDGARIVVSSNTPRV